jgi:D-alanyl-D-alanine carboxypeptidase
MTRLHAAAVAAALFLVTLFPRGAAAAGSIAAPEFSLTVQDLQAMTAGLPRTVQDHILGAPRDFLHLLAQVLDEPADYLVLVDKSHLLSADYAPPDLVSLSAYPLSVGRPDLQLRRTIMPAVRELAEAARAAGATLLFSSSYRSFEYQKSVYEREVRTYGQAAADRESARPGASQHQLGTVVDFGSITDAFADTKAGRWLAAHAGEYGFSLSYPQGFEQVTGYRWESWHYRYITRPGARLQKEYFEDIQQYMLEFLHDNRTALDAKRIPAR